VVEGQCRFLKQIAAFDSAIREWPREIIEDRLKDDEANPDAGESWNSVRERLLDKLRQR
jgi:hypothetical protein